MRVSPPREQRERTRALWVRARVPAKTMGISGGDAWEVGRREAVAGCLTRMLGLLKVAGARRRYLHCLRCDAPCYARADLRGLRDQSRSYVRVPGESFGVRSRGVSVRPRVPAKTMGDLRRGRLGGWEAGGCRRVSYSNARPIEGGRRTPEIPPLSSL
jgi:hypothetical protein